MFDHLSETLNHEVRFAMMDAEFLDFKELESWRVDNLILMAPSIKGKFFGYKRFGVGKARKMLGD